MFKELVGLKPCDLCLRPTLLGYMSERYKSPAVLDMGACSTLRLPLSVFAFSTSWCPSDMYIKMHLCKLLEASGSILVDIEGYGICCIRS